MRITVFLTLACVVCSYATGYSQDKFSLTLKNAKLSEVFRFIQQKTDYQFLYNVEDVEKVPAVSLSVTNATIQEILDICFRNYPLSYRIENKTVVVLPTPPTQEKPSPTVNPDLFVFTVKGKATDQSGNPLVGLNISLSGSQIGTITDEQGNYSLSLPDGRGILVFSYVGFASQEIPVNGRSEINVTMEPGASGLNEVVLVGYGTQRKKDITGAVSVVSSKALEDRPNSQFGYSLEGKAAGVQVIRPSGQPQAGFSIRIRGTSTITAGSEPLYIVDGVPTSSTNEINPADIESMTILKDASSAAIYGSSGSNGVVLITTKRGKNQKTKVNFDAYTGFSSPWKKIPVLTGQQYIDLMGEMGLSPASGWGAYEGVNTNWQDLVFRNANNQNYNLSAAGGNENTQYYMSGSIFKQEGIVINNNVNRDNFKVNLDHRISKIFKIGTSISYNRWTDVSTTENSRNGVIFGLITGAPVIKVFNADGTYTANPLIADVENPVATAEGNDHKWTNSRFQGNAYVEASPLSGLKLRSMFGYEETNGAYNSFVNPFQTREGRTWNGIADQSLNQSKYWISENTATYNKKIKEHDISVLAGFVASNSSSNSLSEHGTGFGGSAVTTVNGAAVHTLSGADISERSNISFLSRINYSFSDRYLLTANFRADASSVFGTENRWGYFPSFSAGWRISNEKFFQNVTAVNDLKLRVGWGEVGNDQIAPYSYLGLVNPSSNYVIDGNAISGTAPTTLENPLLKWETTDQLNIGLDFSILKSRVTLSTDYYIKKTKDLLLQVPIPASVGIPSNSALENAGRIENKGVEFQLTSRNLVKKFRWTTDFNISFNQNKVLDMVGTFIKIGAVETRGNTSIAQVGLPLGTFWGYIYDGVDPGSGNAIYRDLDKNGTIDENDKTVIGNANPKYIFGMTNSFSYRNFTLDIFLQGMQGNQVFNATRVLSEGMTDGKSQSAAVLRRWTTPGQVTNIPRQSLNDPGIPDPTYNSLISSRYVEDGAYLRVKSITLAYNLPGNIISKLKMSRCQIYITSENLFTFTGYSGFDPEVSSFAASGNSNSLKNIAPGVDFGTYPQSRDFLFGLNISF
jgi:TonB-linked SusC/RagA family outer membrane protein